MTTTGSLSGVHARRPLRPIAAPISATALAREVAELPRHRRLCASGSFEVYAATAADAPLVLLEIGRLREECFRAVGEGTGRERDLDRHDATYTHLFAWDTARSAVAGAYRIAATDRVADPRIDLYTHTLFDVDSAFHAKLGPALELGRSFVASAYQRSYAPLLLLWRGIGALLAAQPRYRYLFGALSISSEYNPISRRLMLDFLAGHYADDEWRTLIRARRPVSAAALADAWRDGSRPMFDVDALAAEVERSEEGRRRLPVLIRHYIRLGARVLDFSIDPDFGDAIDAFVVLNPCIAPRELLERYVGKESAAAYLAYRPRDAREPLQQAS